MMYRIEVFDSMHYDSTIHMQDFLGAVELFKALLTVGLYDATLSYCPDCRKEDVSDES